MSLIKEDETFKSAGLALTIKNDNYLPGGSEEQCAHCIKKPHYVVTIISEKEYMEDDGKFHHQKLGLQFCCKEHFDIYWRHIPIMPQNVLSWMHDWAFSEMTKWLKKKEKSNRGE